MLSGKTAVITGANRGIGLEILRKFAEEHADIWACSRTSDPAYEAMLAETAERFQIRIRSVCFDLADSGAVQSAMKQISKEAASVDILVNNAGISHVGLFQMTKTDDIRRVFEINYFAQLQIIQLLSRKMIRQRSGAIINICSASGLENPSGGLAYGSSKAAFLYATRTLATEYGGFGIRVNAVSPGFIDTDMWKTRDEQTKADILANTPLARQAAISQSK